MLNYKAASDCAPEGVWLLNRAELGWAGLSCIYSKDHAASAVDRNRPPFSLCLAISGDFGKIQDVILFFKHSLRKKNIKYSAQNQIQIYKHECVLWMWGWTCACMCVPVCVCACILVCGTIMSWRSLALLYVCRTLDEPYCNLSLFTGYPKQTAILLRSLIALLKVASPIWPCVLALVSCTTTLLQAKWNTNTFIVLSTHHQCQGPRPTL